MRICKEEGISQGLVNINLTFGFLRGEFEELTLPEALTLPLIIREKMFTFLMGINLPSASNKALKDEVPKGLADARVELGSQAGRHRTCPVIPGAAWRSTWNPLLLTRGTSTLAPVPLSEQNGLASKRGKVRKPTRGQAVPTGNYCECLGDAAVSECATEASSQKRWDRWSWR